MNLFKKLFTRHKEDAPDLPPEFHQETPPDWLIDAKGQLLPDGNRFSIRVQLTDASRTGIAEIVILPLNENEQPKSAQTGLLRNEIDRLFVILGFSFPADIDSVAPGAETGAPVNISIHRREPYSSKFAECDLASWLDTRKPGPPIVEIGRVLMDAQARALPFKK
ncbi:MAG TPA: hypothetical protein VFC07_12660 [Verrucomicrobiae bacterium]|nr:hypothetical protein [Verrucomicrobiae bacterium]